MEFEDSQDVISLPVGQPERVPRNVPPTPKVNTTIVTSPRQPVCSFQRKLNTPLIPLRSRLIFAIFLSAASAFFRLNYSRYYRGSTLTLADVLTTLRETTFLSFQLITRITKSMYLYVKKEYPKCIHSNFHSEAAITASSRGIVSRSLRPLTAQISGGSHHTYTYTHRGRTTTKRATPRKKPPFPLRISKWRSGRVPDNTAPLRVIYHV